MASGYWIICTQPYEYEGTEITRGEMDYYTSTRPVVSKKWRKATPNEIETKQNYNGKWFNHNLDD